MPSSSATALATAWLSPVSMATSTPMACSRLTASWLSGPDDIGQGEAGDRALVYHQVHHALALGAGGALELGQRRRQVASGSPAGAARRRAASARQTGPGPHAPATLPKPVTAGRARPRSAALCRMPRAIVCSRSLGGGDKGQGLILVPAVDHGQTDDAEFTAGERAGLVENHGVDVARLFQGQPVAHQDAVLRPMAVVMATTSGIASPGARAGRR